MHRLLSIKQGVNIGPKPEMFFNDTTIVLFFDSLPSI